MFEKGNAHGKGRPKGAPNKGTEEVRELLTTTLAAELKSVGSLLKKIKSPRARIQALSRLLPFVLPRLATADLTIDAEVSQGISHFDFSLLSEDTLKKIFKEIEDHEKQMQTVQNSNQV